MNTHPLIDIQIDRGTATFQLLQWNDTSKRFEVTTSPTIESLSIDNLSGPDAVITMTGTGGNTGLFAYESDTDTFTLNKNVEVDGSLVVSENVDIPITTSTAGKITQNGIRIFHTFGVDNVFVGNSSGNTTLTGSENVGIGDSSLLRITSGMSNFGLGKNALTQLTEASDCIGIGVGACALMKKGKQVVGIGRNALINLVPVFSSEGTSVSIGSFSGTNLVSGFDVVLVGPHANTLASDTIAATAVGRRAKAGSNGLSLGAFSGIDTTEDNALYIDTIDRTSEANAKIQALMYGKFAADPANQTLRVNAETNLNGNVRIGDTTAPVYKLEVAGVTKTGSGRIPKTTRLTADGTTLDTTQHEVFCDTDGGAFMVTLPATPVGQTYRITNSGNNNLTLGRNGNNIKGSATDAIIPSGDTLIITWEPVEGWW